MGFLRLPPWHGGRRCLLLLLVLAVVGCGRPVGAVSGKVEYRGTPVVMGSVVFVGSDGIPHSAKIQEDGTYKIKGVPAETVKVGVISPDPGPPLGPKMLPPDLAPLMQDTKLKGKKAEDAERLKAKMLEVRGIKIDLGSVHQDDRRKWRRLPKQYEDPHSSGLTMKVNKGENTQDITLK
jgi:hypothetical protein